MVALSSREAELYGACEGLTIATNTKAARVFLRMGSRKIGLLMNSSATRKSCHKRCVGKQKHLEIQALRFQGRNRGGLAQVRVAREEDIADMMTHSPSAELAKLDDMIGLKRLTKTEYETFMDGDRRNYRTARSITSMLEDEEL